MGCCVEGGVFQHKFPRVNFKGNRCYKRYCSKCGSARNVFRCKQRCVVCEVGDDSGLDLKCMRLKHCRRKSRQGRGGGLSKGGIVYSGGSL